MAPNLWLPLISVVIGGLLTLTSSLLVERFRVRASDRRDLLLTRRSSLEELERAVTDSHSKFLTSAILLQGLRGKRDRVRTSEEHDEGDRDNEFGRRRADTSESDEFMVRAIAGTSGRVEILRAISLAARIGTPEIRKDVADYASTQLEWAKSPNSGEPVLENMELKVHGMLQLIAAELRELDENVARHLN